MDTSWTISNWIFYAGLPISIFVIIFLLKTYVEPFEQWWYNNVSIRFMGSRLAGHDQSQGHSHSHSHGHSHDHSQSQHGHSHQHNQNHHSKEVDDVKRILFKDLNKIISKNENLKKEGKIRILEIGTGFGANFQYYPDKCNLIALDAFDGFKEKLLSNMKQYPGINLEKFVHKPAENMEGVEDTSIDVVIGTTVFCQVKNMKKVFEEIQRVLVPDGRFYYIEHIAAEPNSWIAFFQTFLTKSGLVPLFTQGHLDRKLDVDILKAGFSNVDQKYIQLKMPHGSWWSWRNWLSKLASRNVVGVATK